MEDGSPGCVYGNDALFGRQYHDHVRFHTEPRVTFMDLDKFKKKNYDDLKRHLIIYGSVRK